jgi:hypothetical protein
MHSSSLYSICIATGSVRILLYLYLKLDLILYLLLCICYTRVRILLYLKLDLILYLKLPETTWNTAALLLCICYTGCCYAHTCWLDLILYLLLCICYTCWRMRICIAAADVYICCICVLILLYLLFYAVYVSSYYCNYSSMRTHTSTRYALYSFLFFLYTVSLSFIRRVTGSCSLTLCASSSCHPPTVAQL